MPPSSRSRLPPAPPPTCSCSTARPPESVPSPPHLPASAGLGPGGPAVSRMARLERLRAWWVRFWQRTSRLVLDRRSSHLRARRTRTPNLLIRSQMLCPIELRAQITYGRLTCSAVPVPRETWMLPGPWHPQRGSVSRTWYVPTSWLVPTPSTAARGRRPGRSPREAYSVSPPRSASAPAAQSRSRSRSCPHRGIAVMFQPSRECHVASGQT